MNQDSERPKVLVVDDSPETLDMLMHLLSDRYAAIPARDGASALCKADKLPRPDIILLDIVMPDMDGFEVCRRLKAQEETRDIPILFLTAMLDQESELNGLTLGAVDYLRKPISPPMVLARLATHLELARSRKALAQRNEVLEEVVRLRDDIERITRHDLKGPLAAMIGFSEVVLEEAVLSEQHKEYLRQGMHAANRMLEMINRSLDLYKMETGRYRFEPQAVDIAKVLHRVCQDLDALARQHAVSITVVLSRRLQGASAAVLRADPLLCHFLLVNLVKNAVEAAPAMTQVTVTIDHPEAAFLRIGIHNRGVVDASMRDKFFEKYTTFGKQKGTGLGTYSAQLMARAQGGRVEMTTDEETGTLVTVYLPR